MFEIILWIILFFICFFILLTSSDWLIKAGTNIGAILKLPPIIIGILFVAISSNIAGLTISVLSKLKGFSDIGIYAIFGSLIFNTLFVIIAIGLLKRKYELQVKHSLNLLFLTFSTFLFVFFIVDLKYTQFESIISVLLLICYSIYVWFKKEKSEKISLPENQISVINFIVFVICFISIYFSANYLITTIFKFSEISNLNINIISLTVVSIGLLIPEFLLIISAIKRDEIDLAISTIISSNIIKTLGILSITRFFGPIIFQETIFFIVPFYLISIILFGVIINLKKINYFHSIFAILIYLAFLFGLIYL